MKKRRGGGEGREEEDSEVECKGWGTLGMSALHSVCMSVCESKHPAMSQTYAAATALNHTPANCFETNPVALALSLTLSF